jgi:hypothetical protein
MNVYLFVTGCAKRNQILLLIWPESFACRRGELENLAKFRNSGMSSGPVLGQPGKAPYTMPDRVEVFPLFLLASRCLLQPIDEDIPLDFR